MTNKRWSFYLLALALLATPLLAQAEQIQQQKRTPENCLPQLTQAERCRRFIGQEALWWRDGRKLYKNNCKSCHHRGNEVGASFFYEESKTQQGWDRVFIKRNSECAKNGSWASLTPKQLQDINDYLYRYAYGTGGIYEARMG